MILGHIGARAGSKGVPRKNFRPLCGKPLIDWSLDQLLESPLIDKVLVSTDDPEIHAHALARGSIDIGLRPADLATDTAAKWHVWQHALSAVEDRIGPVSVFVDIDCTFPLRTREDMEAAIRLFQAERPDMVMSCNEARVNPYFNLLEEDETGALHVSKPLPGGVVARQQAPRVLEHAGTYVLDPGYLRRASALFEGRVLPCLQPAGRSLDIDSELDFRIVECLTRQREID